MRITLYKRFRVNFVFLISVLMSISILIISTVVLAQEENLPYLFIDIHDHITDEQIDGNTFFEGEEYDILVGQNEDGEITWAYNATVIVPWATNIIKTDPPWVTIETPTFEEYPDGFIIEVSKEGYISAEETIIISKGELSITNDRETVEEMGSFSATVRDQNNHYVEGAILYLEVDGQVIDSQTTNENGIAYLEAPEIDNEQEYVTITAFKDGYEPSSSTIRVENVQQSLIGDFTSKIIEMAPILFAIFMVLFAMLFVRFRKGKTMPKSKFKADLPKENRKIFEDKQEKLIDKADSDKSSSYNKTKTESLYLDKGPRLEEIRIHGTDKQKVTKNISENKEDESIKSHHKKDEYQWFEGEDYMKYKIDELTGEADVEMADRWFEGVDDIKSKVDEKLRNKKRKKK